MPSKVQLADYLQPAHITVPLHAETLSQALHEMVQRLRQSGALSQDSEIDALLTRSRAHDVVSIGSGVVLPHFRTRAVDQLVISLGVAPHPLDATAHGIATKPRIVALILAPPAAATLYLQAVAALARFLSGPDVIDQLTEAKSAEEIARLPGLQGLKIEPQLTVRDVMTRDPATVAPDATVRTVVDLMVERRTRCVTVVSESQQVIGILTEWDVMRALLPHIPKAGEMTEEDDDQIVRDVMTRSVLCVPHDMGLPEAVNLMINKNAEQCPVVNEGRLVGMLKRSEIIRKLFAR